MSIPHFPVFALGPLPTPGTMLVRHRAKSSLSRRHKCKCVRYSANTRPHLSRTVSRMAYITRYKDGWRAQVQKHGARTSKTFPTKREAQQWAMALEASITADKTPKGHTFAQAASRYLRDVSAKKDGAKWEALRLAVMAEHFGSATLAEIKAPQIAAWRDWRLESVSGSTVLREANLLRNLFTVARDEWNWCEHYPFRGVKMPDPSVPRHQRWTWQKIKRVLRRLGYVSGQAPQTDNQQVALAFLITLSTSLRASECLRVGPATYDKASRVVVVKAKGKLRSEIPIPRRAAKHCERANFTIDAVDLDSLFRAARDACMVGDLRFHDGRASALTWLAKRVDVLRLSRISQHSDIKLLAKVYYRATAAEIAAGI